MAAAIGSISSVLESSLPPPEVVRTAILNNLNTPVVLKNQFQSFPAMPWTSADLTEKYGLIKLDFRMVSKAHKGISWERLGKVINATIQNFSSWQSESSVSLDDSNPFKSFNKDEFWAYSSYNYMNAVFTEECSIIRDTSWSQFGFSEITGVESTFWLGSEGAYTPCHFDGYGSNLVLQVIGRKKWILFPPTDTAFLYPTRIPFEESSVFSSVNISHPDLSTHPLFKDCHPHVVELEPGDVLFVPHKWWHFVTCMDSITCSTNTWIPLDIDKECRLEESVTKVLMNSFTSFYDLERGENWMNSEEDIMSPEENMQFINFSLKHLKSLRNGTTQPSPKNDTKVLKGSKEDDVASHRGKDHADIFNYQGVKKVERCPIAKLLEKEDKSNSCDIPCTVESDSTPILPLKKIVDCFTHPEVVTLISRLLQNSI